MGEHSARAAAAAGTGAAAAATAATTPDASLSHAVLIVPLSRPATLVHEDAGADRGRRGRGHARSGGRRAGRRQMRRENDGSGVSAPNDDDGDGDAQRRIVQQRQRFLFAAYDAHLDRSFELAEHYAARASARSVASKDSRMAAMATYIVVHAQLMRALSLAKLHRNRQAMECMTDMFHIVGDTDASVMRETWAFADTAAIANLTATHTALLAPAASPARLWRERPAFCAGAEAAFDASMSSGEAFSYALQVFTSALQFRAYTTASSIAARLARLSMTASASVAAAIASLYQALAIYCRTHTRRFADDIAALLPRDPGDGNGGGNGNGADAGSATSAHQNSTARIADERRDAGGSEGEEEEDDDDDDGVESEPVLRGKERTMMTLAARLARRAVDTFSRQRVDADHGNTDNGHAMNTDMAQFVVRILVAAEHYDELLALLRNEQCALRRAFSVESERLAIVADVLYRRDHGRSARGGGRASASAQSDARGAPRTEATDAYIALLQQRSAGTDTSFETGTAGGELHASESPARNNSDDWLYWARTMRVPALPASPAQSRNSILARLEHARRHGTLTRPMLDDFFARFGDKPACRWDLLPYVRALRTLPAWSASRTMPATQRAGESARGDHARDAHTNSYCDDDIDDGDNVAPCTLPYRANLWWLRFLAFGASTPPRCVIGAAADSARNERRDGGRRACADAWIAQLLRSWRRHAAASSASSGDSDTAGTAAYTVSGADDTLRSAADDCLLLAAVLLARQRCALGGALLVLQLGIAHNRQHYSMWLARIGLLNALDAPSLAWHDLFTRLGCKYVQCDTLTYLVGDAVDMMPPPATSVPSSSVHESMWHNMVQAVMDGAVDLPAAITQSLRAGTLDAAVDLLELHVRLTRSVRFAEAKIQCAMAHVTDRAWMGDEMLVGRCITVNAPNDGSGSSEEGEDDDGDDESGALSGTARGGCAGHADERGGGRRDWSVAPAGARANADRGSQSADNAARDASALVPERFADNADWTVLRFLDANRGGDDDRGDAAAGDYGDADVHRGGDAPATAPRARTSPRPVSAAYRCWIGLRRLILSALAGEHRGVLRRAYGTLPPASSSSSSPSHNARRLGDGEAAERHSAAVEALAPFDFGCRHSALCNEVRALDCIVRALLFDAQPDADAVLCVDDGDDGDGGSGNSHRCGSDVTAAGAQCEVAYLTDYVDAARAQPLRRCYVRLRRGLFAAAASRARFEWRQQRQQRRRRRRQQGCRRVDHADNDDADPAQLLDASFILDATQRALRALPSAPCDARAAVDSAVQRIRGTLGPEVAAALGWSADAHVGGGTPARVSPLSSPVSVARDMCSALLTSMQEGEAECRALFDRIRAVLAPVVAADGRRQFGGASDSGDAPHEGSGGGARGGGGDASRAPLDEVRSAIPRLSVGSGRAHTPTRPS